MVDRWDFSLIGIRITSQLSAGGPSLLQPDLNWGNPLDCVKKLLSRTVGMDVNEDEASPLVAIPPMQHL